MLRPALLLSPLILGLVFNACAHSYAVEATEARRLLRAMGQGAPAPSPNSMVVQASRIDENETRWIELWADDLVGVEWEDGGLQSRWARIEDLAHDLPVMGLRYKRPQGTGEALMYASGVFTITGYGMQLASAAWSLGYNSYFDEPLRPEAFIPYYGSILLITEAIDFADAECGHDKAKCAYNIYNAAHGMVSFAAQVLGPVLLVTGALWPDGRERDAPEDAALAFDPVPTFSPFAEGGILLTWTY